MKNYEQKKDQSEQGLPPMVYTVKEMEPFLRGQLDNMDVVEIYPNPKIKRHRLKGTPRNGNDRQPSDFIIENRDNCKDLKDFEWQQGLNWKDLRAYHFKDESLANVISNSIDPNGTALIIVHISSVDTDTKDAQKNALQTAASKGIPIYATFRTSPLADKKIDGKLSASTLPDIFTKCVEAKGACITKNFFGPTGNALWAADNERNFLYRELRNGKFQRAIVIGQALDDCVDSTILGRWVTDYKQLINYEKGLLDMSIAVVTARNVLGPISKKANSYFNFEVVGRGGLPRKVYTAWEMKHI